MKNEQIAPRNGASHPACGAGELPVSARALSVSRKNEMTTDTSDQDSVQMQCHVATRYSQTGYRDLSKIVDASGYHFKKKRIGKKEFETELREHPGYIEDWLLWSADKRWTPAWYSTERDGRYTVGYYSKDASERKLNKPRITQNARILRDRPRPICAICGQKKQN